MRKKCLHIKLRIHLIIDLRNILACMVNEYSTSQIVVKAYDNFFTIIYTYKKKTSCEDTEERLYLILSKIHTTI